MTRLHVIWTSLFLAILLCFASTSLQAEQFEAGSVTVNGQKTFPLGWYGLSWYYSTGSAQTLPLIESAQHGFDYVMPYAPADYASNLEILDYLDTAHALGVKVMIDTHTNPVYKVTSIVNLVKDHPAVYGYYVEDEPAWRGISAAEVISKYNAIKAADPNPNHPALLTFTLSIADYPEYVAGGDIIARELYNEGQFATIESDIATVSAAGKDYVAIPRMFQAYNTYADNIPTAEEFKFLVFNPISKGAGGIMPFIFEGYVPDGHPIPEPGFRDESAYPVTDQLQEIMPTLLKGSGNLTAMLHWSDEISHGKDLSWVFAGDQNDGVLIVTNDNATTAAEGMDFHLSGLDPSITEATVIGENRTISLVDGKLIDDFDAQGVHLYKFTSPPATELPTVHYTFRETSPGTWEVLVDVAGENTAGLSAYEIWVDGVNPATISFTENTLGTTVGEGFVGFAPGTLLQGEVDGSFNAGNFQDSGNAAIEGIGMVEVLQGDGTTALVDLDPQALLGILCTEAGLTEENFRVMVAGLLNANGDGFYNAADIITTLEVITCTLLPGDANRDGVVSAGDYASVQANFGNTGEPGILGDANGDGVVSAGDYAAVQAHFGNTATTASKIPEPVTMSLLVIGGLMAGCCRRRRNA